MNLDGLEWVSSGLHVVGFFVGYCGYNAHKATITGSRLQHCSLGLDESQMPVMMRPKERGP